MIKTITLKLTSIDVIVDIFKEEDKFGNTGAKCSLFTAIFLNIFVVLSADHAFNLLKL